ncbi:MAG: MoxR family ATPase [Desulfobulbaceae bacterium]|nr:MoxR family ATPase [Desulfobulbaceae bacterium]
MSEASLATLKQVLGKAKQEIEKVIIGQHDAVEKALIVILTGNHALIEGVPGVAKTLLVRTLGKVLDVETNRIQFTPDLMPTDITGAHIYNLQEQSFKLIQGPVFTTFLLADEVNRAPAKTQSALLQAMQERKVSIDTDTHDLSPNFTVFATQNPVEYEGTYPLPEAQKDRFMLKITMDQPQHHEELLLAKRTLGPESPEFILENGVIQPAIREKYLQPLRALFMQLTVKEELISYIVDVVRATREHDAVLVGAGPRATQSLLLAARAKAAFSERDFVTPDDVKDMASPVLEHRLILRPEYEIEGLTAGEVVGSILSQVAVPK